MQPLNRCLPSVGLGITTSLFSLPGIAEELTVAPPPQWQSLATLSEPPPVSSAPQWRLVSPQEQILPPPSSPPPPVSTAREAPLQQSEPVPADFLRPLTLGPAVPTANQLPDQELQFSALGLSPLNGSGSTGSGASNQALRLDVALSDRLQASAFYSQAPDPLVAAISGSSVPVANSWESFGGALQWRVASDPTGRVGDGAGQHWNLALLGSLEGWNVGSGGCSGVQCATATPSTANLFNSSAGRVFTRNLVGSLALPFSWNATPQWQLTLTPGASFLPAGQGAGQGGAGRFYGSSAWLGGGALWRLRPELQLFSSALLPLGPGTNSFDAKLNYRSVPIFSGGLQWALNPRLALSGLLTNGWGATPATALLALPSASQLGYAANLVFTPGGVDTPQPALSPRQWSLASGGLTVNTALVPPAETTQLWLNADSKGNGFGMFGYSLSNLFQLELLNAGVYQGVKPGTAGQRALVDQYGSGGSWNWRVAGKAVPLSPLRGGPFWGAGRVSVGRGSDPSRYQDYVFAETIGTWELTPTLALNVNPKLAWTLVGTPWAVGISANVQVGPRFQLIPEVNLVGSNVDASNVTVALRWVAVPAHDRKSTTVDVYVSNASGLQDLGQLISSSAVRVGGRLSFTF